MSQSRSLLIILVSAMELSWLYPWLAILGHAATGYERVLKPGIAFGLFFLAMLVAQLLSRGRIANRYQRIAVGGLILLTALLLIQAQVYSSMPLLSFRWLGSSLAHLLRFERAMSRELFLMLATFVLWWRGLRTSQDLLITDVVGFKFRIGILLLIGLLVVQALTYREDMIGWVLSLFLCGLVAVALARIKDGTPAGQASGRFSLPWLFFLLVGAGGTLLLGLLLSTLFTTETVISRALRPVFHALRVVFLYALVAISYVLIWAINAIVQWFVQMFVTDEAITLETFALSPLEMPDLGQTGEVVAPPAWFDWVQQGVVALAVVGLFALLLLVVRRWRLAPSDRSDVWRESVWSSGEVGRGLLEGLRGGLRQLAALLSGQEGRRAYSAATVRKMYASLLALAERRGLARQPSRTPFEYLPALRGAFPGWGAELQALTRAYVEAHYGQLPDTEAELQALHDAWQHIHGWAEAHPKEETVA